MNIFIEVYHMVNYILLTPKRIYENIINKKMASEKVQEDMARRERLLKERTEGLDNQNNDGNKKYTTDSELKRITFDYVVLNSYGQTVKSSFDAYAESEVRAFLVNEGYKIVSITPRSKWQMDIALPGTKKISTNSLTFALTQLATYIKAGIPLIDSVRILAKQSSNKREKKVYERIVYDLVTGQSFSEALEDQSDVFPRLLINMIKTAEMTGDLSGVLDEMSEYYKSIEQTRKQMLTALIYPAVIFFLSIAVVTFCLMYVVPTFVSMYSSSGTALPAITTLTLNISNFLTNNYLIIIVILLIIIVAYTYAFKNVKSFRKTMQTIYMKLPFIGNIIIYNEVTMFTKTFSSLLLHDVNINDSMEVLSKITNNEVYKDIIFETMDTLTKGGRISEAFRGKWAFPVVAYEMLVTGESTGQLGVMMEKVADHYDNLHKNAISALKSLIEPITIVFLAIAVGFIIISIVVPMFDVYSTVQ